MPRLDAFPAVSQGWINQVTAVSTAAVKDAIAEGADFMRKGIENSPTGTNWHSDKNAANPGFPDGARIGNRNPNFGTEPIDPNSGLMLASVSTVGPVKSSASSIEGFFGWVDDKEPYFLLQDVGNYSVGNQSGMGLINQAINPQAGVKQYGAALASQQSLIKSLKAAGLKHNDLGGGA
jgi:hypothetical protein